MIRVNSLQHITIEQSISYDFDMKTIDHCVKFFDHEKHVYEKYCFSDFKQACNKFEELETLAYEREKEYAA